MCMDTILRYFDDFLTAAASKATPAASKLVGKYVGAAVSATIASQIRLRPACQGIMVKPSGLFPLDLQRLVPDP